MDHMYNTVSTSVTPPMYSLHKSTHIHTHTYMPTSRLLSLPSSVFMYISPLCPTQGSRLADVVTTSTLGQLKVTSYHRTLFTACTLISLISIISYLLLYVFKFELVDYVFSHRSVHLQLLAAVTWLYLLISFFHFIIMCGNEDRIRTFDNYIAIGAIYIQKWLRQEL